MKALITIIFVFIINSVIGQSRELFDIRKHIQVNSQKQDKSEQQEAIKQFRDRFNFFIPVTTDDLIKENEKSSIAGKMPTLTFQKPVLGLMSTIKEKEVTIGKIPDLE